MKTKLFIFLITIGLNAGELFAIGTLVNGIYYNFDTSNFTASVTYRGESYSAYNEYTGMVTIPSNITYNGEDYIVTNIEDDAFRDCTNLNSIIIRDGLAHIGQNAFRDCKALSSINIPNSVISIGSNALYNNSSPILQNNTDIGTFTGTAWYNKQPDGLVYVGKVAYKYKGITSTLTSCTLKDG